MQAVVDSLLTNYRKTGQGKAVVMLHGWGDDSSTFGELAASISSKYSVLALDLPGFGGTQAPTEAWSLSDYAKFVSAWLSKIDVKEVEAIVGHSFGGAVSIVAVAAGVIKPRKLILLASAGVRLKRSLRLRALRAGAKLGKLPLYLLPANKAKKIKIYFYGKIGSDMMLRPDMRRTFVKTIKEDLREAAGHIKTPSLLIYGEEDRETPLNDGRLLHQAIKGSKLESIEEAGHFVHHQKPDQIAQLVLDFLSEAKK